MHQCARPCCYARKHPPVMPNRSGDRWVQGPSKLNCDTVAFCLRRSLLRHIGPCGSSPFGVCRAREQTPMGSPIACVPWGARSLLSLSPSAATRGGDRSIGPRLISEVIIQYRCFVSVWFSFRPRSVPVPKGPFHRLFLPRTPVKPGCAPGWKIGAPTGKIRPGFQLFDCAK